jgi:transposase InsO family protein
MNEQAEASPQGKEPLPPEGGKKSRRKNKVRRYAYEVKLKAVKLYLEDQYSGRLVAQELGVSQQSLSGWIRDYRALGEAGLKEGSKPRRGGRSQLPAPVAQRILQLKRENPTFGVKRIAQWMRRFFLMEASPETVRQKLHDAGLLEETRPHRTHNLTRPRFFERATPNQMWQSDIFTFRLGGKYAYLIAFLDDYSRFVAAADLFRSPTAQAVIEVYRVGTGEFKPPKEMLTDNGRQYTSWRGTSRFEAELRKDRVAHIKSRPHHPMTLGKVERFWSTIWQEFLARAQFDSFENARERIKTWIKYYNHKRPNQGIGGLCPADRFFEIQTELRKTLEAGIKDNLLEMALRGEPRAPFYMVGRMEGQSVVLRAEKGKLKLELSNEQSTQELTYNLNPSSTQTQTHSQPGALGAGQSAGSAGGVDGALQTGGGVPAAGHPVSDPAPVATPGDGGNAPSPGEPGQPEGGRSLESEAAGAPGAAVAGGTQFEAAVQAGAGAEQACERDGQGGMMPFHERPQGAATRPVDHAGPSRSDHRDGGGTTVGDLPQDVLPVGSPCPEGPVGGSDPAAARSATPTRSGRGTPTGSEGGSTPEGIGPGAREPGNPRGIGASASVDGR